MPEGTPLVGIIMGSDSDWPKIGAVAKALDEFDVPHEIQVMSAHRTPDVVMDYATTAIERGLRVIIAAAGGAAHLAGVVASHTTLPVIGIPVPTSLQGAKMLGVKKLNLQRHIAGFISTRLVKCSKSKLFTWKERKRPHE